MGPVISLRLALASILLVSATAAPAQVAEIYGGIMAHGPNTPITAGVDENGTDLELGLRSDPIDRFRGIGRPSAHLMVSINDGHGADFVAAGLDWKFGHRFYVRPGIGIAMQDGPAYRVSRGFRSDLGSRILFEPELSAGIQLSSKASVEASWVHLSHAKLAGRNNPGLDMIGVRLAYRIR